MVREFKRSVLVSPIDLRLCGRLVHNCAKRSNAMALVSSTLDEDTFKVWEFYRIELCQNSGHTTAMSNRGTGQIPQGCSTTLRSN